MRISLRVLTPVVFLGLVLGCSDAKKETAPVRKDQPTQEPEGTNKRLGAGAKALPKFDPKDFEGFKKKQ
jgi:hypothetical protein